MIRYERPPQPSDFDDGSGSAIENARQNAQDAALSVLVEHADKLPDELPRGLVSFQSLWGEDAYKSKLMRAQHSKCGYCEREVGAGWGDVEHFRPKGEVTELAAAGEETKDLLKPKGRKERPLSRLGYWFQAYVWSNYLISCTICNQAWKRNLFPVDQSEGPRSLPPDPDVEEEPLLLNPFDLGAPLEHLEFDDVGQINGLTEKGRKTIETCGLDRPSLVKSRIRVVLRVQDDLEEIRISGDAGAIDRVLREGQDSYEFAGVVRSLLWTKLEIKWSELSST